MPAVFSVPSIFRTLYKNHVTVNFSTSRPKPVSRSLIIWLFSSYQRCVWILFYAALFTSVVFVATLLQTSGFAEKIMMVSRQRASFVYRQVIAQDNSSIRLTASTGLTALIRSPQDLLIGDTVDGLRYHQIEDAKISQQVLYSPQEIWMNKSFSRWGVSIPTPSNGEYHINVHAKYTGTYRFQIILTGIDGITQTTMPLEVSLVGGQSRQYTLAFQKYPVSNSRLYQ